MSLIYRVLYRVGFTPWETDEIPRELRGLVEGGDALAAGRALDIGCGTGSHAVYLARHGWQVTAIDVVAQPLRRAQARAEASGVIVDWINGDVTRRDGLGLTPGFSLVFDRGCYHGLSDQGRHAYVDAVTRVASAGATLLIMAFAPNRVPVGPSGADERDISARFDEWDLTRVGADSGRAPGGPLRNVPRSWYRLTRR